MFDHDVGLQWGRNTHEPLVCSTKSYKYLGAALSIKWGKACHENGRQLQVSKVLHIAQRYFKFGSETLQQTKKQALNYRKQTDGYQEIGRWGDGLNR